VYPDAYQMEIRGNRTALALRGEAASVFGTLFDGAGATPLESAGRAPVYHFPLSAGEGVLRYYRRGGVAAWLADDRFLGNRMAREFDLLVDYYRGGGAVPEPLGVFWERRGFVFRGAIATRRIAGVTLLDALRDSDAAGAAAALVAAGGAIRHMHDYGIWHADLQLKNILVSDGAVWLIDFDGARRVRALGRLQRCRNLLRLRRSFEKLGPPLNNFSTLLEGYGPIRFPSWLDWAYRLRGASARLRGADSG